VTGQEAIDLTLKESSARTMVAYSLHFVAFGVIYMKVIFLKVYVRVIWYTLREVN